MYNDTVTLFNRYQRRGGDIWYPTILRGVHVNIDKAAIIAKYGAESKDNASLHVRFSVENGQKMVAGKIWLPPKSWEMQTNDMLPQTITFSGGTAFDFFCLGEWDDSEPISDSDYSSDAGFYGLLNGSRDYVFAVSSVGGPYSVIPHFEIMGR